MDSAQVSRYLDRIGATMAIGQAPDRELLAGLQRAHLRTVPFENLSIHLGEPIVLAEADLFAKIVDRRRGGYCYEANGLFASLLTALGFEVDLLAARVFGGDRFGPPFDHLALRVRADEPLLVDVGFGRFAMEPLRLAAGADQLDPAGTFRIEAAGPDLDVIMDGQPQYRLDTRAYRLSDFGPTNFWQSTSPESHFTKSLTCSLPTAEGRITLSGDRLIVSSGAERTERRLDGDAAVLGAYREWFGIDLDRVPRVSDQS